MGGPIYTEVHKVAVVNRKYCIFKPLKGKRLSFTKADIVRNALSERRRLLLEISFARAEYDGFELLGFCDMNGGFFFKPLPEKETESKKDDQ